MEKLIEFSDFENNISYRDIEIARRNKIEGFLVTELSEEFKEKNSHINLAGNIIHKNILNNYFKYYINNTEKLTYFELNRSSENSVWSEKVVSIYRTEYKLNLMSYSI